MRELLLDNPVAAKEFRARMRGARAYWLLFAYLALLSLTLFFAYLSWWNTHTAAMDTGGAGTASYTIGRTFFLTLFCAQAILITLITPALTAGAISIEREQRTFEMLRSTTLPPRSIAIGKLASSVSFIVLLLTSSLPLISLCFLLGGVSPGEIFFSYVLLVADAFLFGAIGLAWSAHAANTAAATALSYGTIFAWFVATWPFMIPLLQNGGMGAQSGIGFGAVNPIGAVMGAVQPEQYYGWSLAGWIPALLIVLAFGTLLMLICINRLEDDPARRAGPLRIAALALCALLLFFGNGMILGPQASFMPYYMSRIWLGTIALLAAVLFLPPFLTGDALLGRVRDLGRGYLRAGLPFGLVLTALIVGMLYLGLHFGLSAQLASPISSVNRQSLSTVFGGDTVQFWERLTVLLAAFVFGMGGMGLFLSGLLKNRWAALTGLYLLVILATAMPYFSYATLAGRDAVAAGHDPAIRTLYLCPWMDICQLSYLTAIPGTTATYGSYGATFTASFPITHYLSGSLWLVSTSLYVLLGVLGYALGMYCFHRTPRHSNSRE